MIINPRFVILSRIFCNPKCLSASIWFMVSVFIIRCVLPLPSQAAAESVRVKQQQLFVIFSYPLGQWSDGIIAGLSQNLEKMSIPFELKFYVYDSPYYTQKTEKERDVEIENILKRVQDYKPDFIIVCDDEGADVLIPSLKALEIPILFAGINKEEADIRWLKRNAQLTGVFERYPIEASLKLLSNLTGGKVENISLITSSNPTSEIVVRQFQEYFKANKTKILLKKIHMTNKWDDWKSAIKTANQESHALWMLVPWNIENHNGDRMDLRVMGKWLSENIKIPSISIVDVNLHLGVMASISMTPQIMGEELSDIIHLSVIEHRPISKIPYRYPSKYEIIINKKQADKLKITIPVEMLEYAQIIKEENPQHEQ